MDPNQDMEHSLIADAILDRESPLTRPGTSGTRRALVVTPTIPYSQILASDNEPTANPNPTTVTTQATTTTRVKELRSLILQHGKTIRQSLLDMAKADHHRAVLRQAQRDDKIPKGLQINIVPHIFKPDPQILSQWDLTLKGFSETLVGLLITHYSKVVECEQTLQNHLQSEMQSTLKLSTTKRRR
jgi:hypothetical protein